ncbi:MAG: hypothetical protein JRI97_05585 [Deltaproteobacteria bacterium]|nr:hypothetical protein [Deltaproteobacteria bacterium]
MSSRTDCLVKGEDPGGELEEAKKKGARIVGEKEFLKLAGKK